MQLSTNNRGFAPANLTEAIQFSDLLASSSIVPKAYQGKPQDILVCVQWGYEMGLAPMQALQNIAVINGKPSVFGDAAMALVQSSSVCEDVEEFFENEGSPNPVAVCVAKRKGRKPVIAKFSVEDAKRAGLWGKQGPWSAYPKRMMQMRARGFALRDAFPDVLKGMITAEEAQDYQDEAKSMPVAKPANPLDLVAPKIVEIKETPIIEDEVADVQEVVEELEVATATVATDAAFKLFVPKKTEPHSSYETLEAWQAAYEDLADKTAKAGKVEPRLRMTALREFKEANEATLKGIDTVVRSVHTAAYQKRIKALGAAQ